MTQALDEMLTPRILHVFLESLLYTRQMIPMFSRRSCLL